MSGALTDTSILAGASGAEAYTIDQSLRFNDGDNGRLTRTPSSAGDRRTFTISCWAKLGAKFAARTIFGDAGADKFAIHSDYLALILINGSIGYYHTQLTTLLRDPAAWYHIVYVVDTTEAVDTDRLALYLNGEKLTPSGTPTYPSQDAQTGVNNNALQEVGAVADAEDYDGYLAEFCLIDGQALTPSSFGKTNTTTNQWVPIDVSSLTFGTNGFYQKYAGTMDGYTKLLLHCDGANDGTTFTDSSPSAHTMTANGDAHTDTAVKKFGTASAQFDGTGDSISCADDSDFNFASGDFTVEMWIRRTSNSSGNQEMYYGQHQDGNNKIHFYDNGNGTLYWNVRSGGATRVYDWTSSAVLSVDTWHHVAWVRNGSTFKVYVDGTEPATYGYDPFDNGAFPDLTGDVHIGGNGVEITRFPGYVDEVRVSKGIARYTAAFTVATEPFGDTSIGADSSGNDNTFTPTNLVATDKMVDSPTNNFCTFNPLSGSSDNTYSEGNLSVSGTGGSYKHSQGTVLLESGKWYWENYMGSTNTMLHGITDSTTPSGSDPSDGDVEDGYYYGDNGNKRSLSGTQTSYGANYTSGDIISTAIDLDSGTQTVTFYKNGSSQGSIDITRSTTWVSDIAVGDPTNLNIANFGQDGSFAGTLTAQGNQDENGIGDFYYEPPTGYLALCTSNLPDPEIKLPGEHFNTVLYTGTGSSNARTGIGFQPDFLWIKNRNGTFQHMLFDAIRLAPQYLSSQNNDAENTDANQLSSFDSDGFTVGSGSSTNGTGSTFVAWNWKAGGASTVTNNDGTTESEVSVNSTAGFSIVTYTGDGANATVGHGLSEVPTFLMVKCRSSAANWRGGTTFVSGKTYADGNGYYYELDDTKALQNPGSAVVWGSTPANPTASVFSVGPGHVSTNQDTDTYVAYAFHSVEGYSSVGIYEGNNNADGPFIYTGFRPAYILIKDFDTDIKWQVLGYSPPYNVLTQSLEPDSGAAQSDAGHTFADMLSNGFKLRNTGTDKNAAETYLYMAFAESPFKYANAR